MAVYLSVNSSEIVKFLLNTNDGRGGRPDWTILSSTYASAKILELGGEYSIALLIWETAINTFLGLCT